MYNFAQLPPPLHLPVTTPMQNNTIQYVKTYIYNGFFFNLLTTVLVSFWYKQVSPRNVYFLVFKGTRWPDIPLKHGIHSSFNITSIFISQLCKTHHAYRDSLHLDRFFIRVLLLFYMYSLVWWDFNQRYPVSLYFSFPYYNTLFITGRSSAHASPCVTVGKLFVTSWKYM